MTLTFGHFWNFRFTGQEVNARSKVLEIYYLIYERSILSSWISDVLLGIYVSNLFYLHEFAKMNLNIVPTFIQMFIFWMRCTRNMWILHVISLHFSFTFGNVVWNLIIIKTRFEILLLLRIYSFLVISTSLLTSFKTYLNVDLLRVKNDATMFISPNF